MSLFCQSYAIIITVVIFFILARRMGPSLLGPGMLQLDTSLHNVVPPSPLPWLRENSEPPTLNLYRTQILAAGGLAPLLTTLTTPSPASIQLASPLPPALTLPCLLCYVHHVLPTPAYKL